jgi:hypothetical protein
VSSCGCCGAAAMSCCAAGASTCRLAAPAGVRARPPPPPLPTPPPPPPHTRHRHWPLLAPCPHPCQPSPHRCHCPATLLPCTGSTAAQPPPSRLCGRPCVARPPPSAQLCPAALGPRHVADKPPSDKPSPPSLVLCPLPNTKGRPHLRVRRGCTTASTWACWARGPSTGPRCSTSTAVSAGALGVPPPGQAGKGRRGQAALQWCFGVPCAVCLEHQGLQVCAHGVWMHRHPAPAQPLAAAIEWGCRPHRRGLPAGAARPAAASSAAGSAGGAAAGGSGAAGGWGSGAGQGF